MKQLQSRAPLMFAAMIWSRIGGQASVSQPCSSQRMNCTRTGAPASCDITAAACAASSQHEWPNVPAPS